MSNLSDVLDAGVSFLAVHADGAGNQATWNAQTLDCVWHEEREADELEAGGMNEAGTVTTILVPVSEFADATRPAAGEAVTFKGKSWKVRGTRLGASSVEVDLYSAELR